MTCQMWEMVHSSVQEQETPLTHTKLLVETRIGRGNTAINCNILQHTTAPLQHNYTTLQHTATPPHHQRITTTTHLHVRPRIGKDHSARQCNNAATNYTSDTKLIPVTLQQKSHCSTLQQHCNTPAHRTQSPQRLAA